MWTDYHITNAVATDLEALISFSYSRNECLQSPSKDRPCPRKKGCSGLEHFIAQQKNKWIMKSKWIGQSSISYMKKCQEVISTYRQKFNKITLKYNGQTCNLTVLNEQRTKLIFSVKKWTIFAWMKFIANLANADRKWGGT